MLRTVSAAALGVAAAAPVTGCGLLDREPVPEPTPDPLAPLLANALALAARYEAAFAAHSELTDRLTAVAQAHRAHAAELARITRATPASTAATGTPTPVATQPGDVASTLAALRTLEQEGREMAAQACLAAPAVRAGLLGSIAAARSTHLEVLR